MAEPKKPKKPSKGSTGKRTRIGSKPAPLPSKPAGAPSKPAPPPSLGEAVPTSQTRRRVQSGFLRTLLGLADSGQREAEKRRKENRKNLKGQVGFLRRTVAAIGRGVTSVIGAALGQVRKAVGAIAGSDNRLYDRPVSELRKDNRSPTALRQSAGGAKMIGVSSSNVFSVGFDPSEKDPNRGTMTIQFRRESRVYTYDDAPKWMVDGLLSSRSPGRYVWDFVRAVYDHTSMYRRVS